MSFNAASKPSNWLYLTTEARANAILDADVSGGFIRIGIARPSGPIIDEFATNPGVVVNAQRYVETPSPRYAARQGWYWQTFASGSGTWTVASGSMTWAGSGRGIAFVDTFPDGAAGNRTVTTTFSITSGSAFLSLHTSAFNANRCIVAAVGSKLAIGAFVGATTLTAGTHTIRAVVTDSVVSTSANVAIYLDGNLEGTHAMEGAAGTETRRYGIGVNSGAVGVAFTRFEVEEVDAVEATTWVCRDMADGTIVESGDIDNKTEILVPDQPYGSYHLMTYGPTRGGTTDGDRLFHDEYGDIYFGRLPDRPVLGDRPSTTAATTTPGSEWDDPTRGWLGFGPTRMGYGTTTLPSGATMYASAAAPTTYYVDEAPSNRPRYLTAQFADGAAGQDAAVTAIVNAAKTRVKVWEAYNEPPIRNAGEVTTYINTYLAPTYAAIKAADPDAIVLAPANVNPDPNDYQYFFDGGGLDYCDAVSFHAYNLTRRDIGRMRRVLANFLAVTDAAGVARSNIWQTEQGGLFEHGGRLGPIEAAQDIASQIFLQELNGITMEHNVLWYDDSHGFDSYPGNTLGHYDNSVTPAALTVRNMAAEIHNSVFERALNFGDAADSYLAGVWAFDDGSKVLGFMAESDTLPDVQFGVHGVTSVIHVDPWGNETTLPVTANRVTVPSTSLLASWVRIPAGANVWLPSITRSENYALVASGASIASTGTAYQTLTRAIDGDHHSIGLVGYTTPAGTSGQTQTWTVDLGQSRIVGRVELRIIGAAQFTIDTSPDGSTWTTRYTYDHDKVMVRYAGSGRCFWTNYAPPDTQHMWSGDSITARYVRVAITDVMWGEVYIANFGEEAQANEAYDADTSMWPMLYLVQVPWIRLMAPDPEQTDRDRFNLTVTCSG